MGDGLVAAVAAAPAAAAMPAASCCCTRGAASCAGSGTGPTNHLLMSLQPRLPGPRLASGP
eukprot:8853772-Alexandrium_andersonii.AAC.1